VTLPDASIAHAGIDHLSNLPENGRDDKLGVHHPDDEHGGGECLNGCTCRPVTSQACPGVRADGTTTQSKHYSRRQYLVTGLDDLPMPRTPPTTLQR
jgi:hypothetical protein